MVMVSTYQNPNLTPKNAPLVPPKKIFFNFELEQKLDQNSGVEFHAANKIMIVSKFIQSNQML